jgi:hypothetical protein
VLSKDAFDAAFDAYYMRLSEAHRIARFLPAACAA